MATNYILTVDFTEQGIDTLKQAGQNVALVRRVTPSRPGELAWLTFFPRTVSTVTWTEEDYYLFVHQPQSGTLQPGQTIYINVRSEPVVPGGVYSLANNGLFARVDGDAGPGNVAVTNNGPEYFRDHLYFGLAQAGTVFSDQHITAVTPLNLVNVPYNMQAAFSITKWVSVFAGDMPTSTILGNNVISQALDLNFTPTFEHAIRYDASINQFLQQT
jgi:hypothetical protein